MSARQLCRQTQLPSKALFYFPEEGKTGIAPTRIIIEKDAVEVGATVTVNWQGEHVPAKVIALSSKYSYIIRKYIYITYYKTYACLSTYLLLDFTARRYIFSPIPFFP